MELERPQELIKADAMLRYFRLAETGNYKLNAERVALVKRWWDELHSYDEGYEYTFNEEFTILTKRKI